MYPWQRAWSNTTGPGPVWPESKRLQHLPPDTLTHVPGKLPENSQKQTSLIVTCWIKRRTIVTVELDCPIVLDTERP